MFKKLNSCFQQITGNSLIEFLSGAKSLPTDHEKNKQTKVLEMQFTVFTFRQICLVVL